MGAVGGCSRLTPVLMVSFWGWTDVDEETVVTVMVGGRSRGAGTGGKEAAVGAEVAAGTAADGGCVPLARLPVRMLHRLSEELLHPD